MKEELKGREFKYEAWCQIPATFWNILISRWLERKIANGLEKATDGLEQPTVITRCQSKIVKKKLF